jgi:hypothetical protein
MFSVTQKARCNCKVRSSVVAPGSQTSGLTYSGRDVEYKLCKDNKAISPLIRETDVEREEELVADAVLAVLAVAHRVLVLQIAAKVRGGSGSGGRAAL